MFKGIIPTDSETAMISHLHRSRDKTMYITTDLSKFYPICQKLPKIQ